MDRRPFLEIWTKARATPHNSIFHFVCIFIEFLGRYSVINYLSLLFLSKVLSFDFFLVCIIVFKIDIGNKPDFFKAKNQPLHELCLRLADLDFMVDLHDHLVDLKSVYRTQPSKILLELHICPSFI